jgi:hypothetical protein
MNIMRRVRIHSVGIGEARETWIRPISERNFGSLVFFGEPTSMEE